MGLLISFKHWTKTSSADNASFKTHKKNPYLLNLFSPWIFCRFLKFPKNVESPFTNSWNCSHERYFKLHISFVLETGSTRKVSIPFWFVAASTKKSFHISVMSHNAEVKLCNLYQFAETFNDLGGCKIFFSSIMFHHFTIHCIWLMLFLHELKQVLVKHFTSASSIEAFLSSRYYSHVSSLSQLTVCKRRNLLKAFYIQQIKWSIYPDVQHKTCTMQIHLTWINHNHDPCLRWIFIVLIQLGLVCTCIWLSLLNPYLHSGETRYDLNNWYFWLLNILNLLNKSNHKW